MVASNLRVNYLLMHGPAAYAASRDRPRVMCATYTVIIHNIKRTSTASSCLPSPISSLYTTCSSVGSRQVTQAAAMNDDNLLMRGHDNTH